MDIITQLTAFYNQFSAKERETADKIFNNLEPLANGSAKEAAKSYNSSPATLVRLAKKIGLSGYSELSFQAKQFIHAEIKHSNQSKNKNELKNIILPLSNAIEKIASFQNEKKLNLLIKKIYTAKRVFIIGSGYSGLLSEYLRYKFLPMGKAIHSFTEGPLINNVDKAIQKGDIVIILSISGSSNSYQKIYKKCKEDNIFITLITMNQNSKELADVDLSFLLPTASSINHQYEIQFVDPQPIFLVFVNCIGEFYQKKYFSK